jgi:hypothetical protein
MLTTACKSDNGLAAFAHELAVAVHLWTEDFDVEFTDIEDRTRFDILARRAGIELEVDCKTASGDLGRQIHRGRALELFNRICPAVDALLEKGRSRTVDIVLPGRLHGAEPYMNAVAKGVSDAILQDKSQSIADIVDVSLGEFDLRGPPTQQALENVAHLGHPNSNAMGRGNHRQRAAAVVVVSSRKPDKVPTVVLPRAEACMKDTILIPAGLIVWGQTVPDRLLALADEVIE